MTLYKHIDVQQAQQLLQADNSTPAPLVLDIRDEVAYASGHIPGAVHLGAVSLPDLLEQTAAEQPIVVCCYHGISSQPAAQYIAAQGFSCVYTLDGGFAQWQLLMPEHISTRSE